MVGHFSTVTSDVIGCEVNLRGSHDVSSDGACTNKLGTMKTSRVKNCAHLGNSGFGNETDLFRHITHVIDNGLGLLDSLDFLE